MAPDWSGMSDLIRREDVLAVLCFSQETGQMVCGDLRKLLEEIKAIPSAQPEWKKGKWNYIGDNMFKCTCCGVLYTAHQLNGLRNYDTDPYVPYFCPNCGAEMRLQNA